MKIVFLLVSLSLCLTAFEHPISRVAIAQGDSCFSPTGKHLLVFETQGIRVYDTITGSNKGLLDASSSTEKQYPHQFIFSPRGTYVSGTHRIWALATLKEHLPGILAARTITAWSQNETHFVCLQVDVNHRLEYGVYDASTGQLVATLTSKTAPLINPDGTCFAVSRSHRFNITLDELALVDDTGGFQLMDVRGTHLMFCPDSLHALVVDGCQIKVINYREKKVIHEFTCANPTADHTGRMILTSVRIKPHGNSYKVKNHLDPKNYCIISQNGSAFECRAHDKKNKEKLLSPHRHYTLIKERLPDRGLKYYDVSLESKAVKTHTKIAECILSFYKHGITFAGAQDQYLFITDEHKKTTTLFDVISKRIIKIWQWPGIMVSPDGNSFSASEDYRSYLYLIPSAAEILARQSDSFFSLLPADLQNQSKLYDSNSPVHP